MDQVDWSFLKRYAENYIKRFNEVGSQLDKLAPLGTIYSQKLVRSSIFIAMDGVAIFYFRNPPDKLIPHENVFGMTADTLLSEGVSIFPNQDVSLTYLLQYLTYNLIKVLQTPSPTQEMREDNWQSELQKRIPADIPSSEIKVTTINKELLEAAIPTGQNLPVTRMAVAPITDYEKGYAKATTPTRRVIYSPVVRTEEKPFLLFSWPILEVLWQPRELGIAAEAGLAYAEADVQVLTQAIEIGVEIEKTLSSPFSSFHRDPYTTVSKGILAICDEFERLINDKNTDEKGVQTFLEKREHRFMVSPIHKEIIPRLRLGHGKYVIDFAVLKPDGEYHLIEIENPNRPIYTQGGQSPAVAFNQAVQQVEDWLRYVEDNRDTIRREDRLTTIYRPTGEIVVGRDRDFTEDAHHRFKYKQSQSSVHLRTYDMLLANVRAYAKGLTQLSTHIPNVDD